MDEAQKLIEQLKDADLNARRQAAEKLAKLKEERAIPVLAALLEDVLIGLIPYRYPQGFSPNYAAKALAPFGKPAVKELTRALRKKGSLDAAWALGEIRDPAAFVPLYKVIDHGGIRGQAAADALRKISEKHPQIKRFLKDQVSKHMKVLEQDDEKAMVDSIEMLRSYADPDSVSALVRMLEKAKMKYPHDTVIWPKEYKAIHLEFIYAIQNIADCNPGDPRLAQALTEFSQFFDDPVVRRIASDVLAKMGEPGATLLEKYVMSGYLMTWEEGIHGLLKYIENCKDSRRLDEIVSKAEQSIPVMMKKNGIFWGEKEKETVLSIARIRVAALKISSAKRRNQLVQSKGIILPDKPKPPKKGRIYQGARRQTNG